MLLGRASDTIAYQKEPAGDVKERRMNFDDPWAWMQPYYARRFGEVILDKKEQERWCRAVLLGGLPFMWRKAKVARDLIYDRLELRPGAKVLIIGESLAPCG